MARVRSSRRVWSDKPVLPPRPIEAGGYVPLYLLAHPDSDEPEVAVDVDDDGYDVFEPNPNYGVKKEMPVQHMYLCNFVGLNVTQCTMEGSTGLSAVRAPRGEVKVGIDWANVTPAIINEYGLETKAPQPHSLFDLSEVWATANWRDGVLPQDLILLAANLRRVDVLVPALRARMPEDMPDLPDDLLEIIRTNCPNIVAAAPELAPMLGL